MSGQYGENKMANSAKKKVFITKHCPIKPDYLATYSIFKLIKRNRKPGLWTTGYGLWIRNYGLHLDKYRGMSFLA